MKNPTMTIEVTIMDNEQLCEKAEDAISELFSDTSVSLEITRENLDNLIVYIQTMLDSLESSDE